MENPIKMDDLGVPHVATVGICTDWLPGRCKGNCRHLEGMENLCLNPSSWQVWTKNVAVQRIPTPQKKDEAVIIITVYKPLHFPHSSE